MCERGVRTPIVVVQFFPAKCKRAAPSGQYGTISPGPIFPPLPYIFCIIPVSCYIFTEPLPLIDPGAVVLIRFVRPWGDLFYYLWIFALRIPHWVCKTSMGSMIFIAHRILYNWIAQHLLWLSLPVQMFGLLGFRTRHTFQWSYVNNPSSVQKYDWSSRFTRFIMSLIWWPPYICGH